MSGCDRRFVLGSNHRRYHQPRMIDSRPIHTEGTMSKVFPLAVFSAVSCWAQLDRGTLTGIVSDPSGAVVPAVKITATHLDTGVSTSTLANETGDYTMVSLPNRQLQGELRRTWVQVLPARGRDSH